MTVAERVWYKRKDSTTKRGKRSRKEKRKEKEMKVLRDTSAPPSRSWAHGTFISACAYWRVETVHSKG